MEGKNSPVGPGPYSTPITVQNGRVVLNITFLGAFMNIFLFLF